MFSGGRRACPPEDCGGVWGYQDFLEAINNPYRERHEKLLDWIGGEFNAEHFDPTEIVFDDPEKRKRISLEFENSLPDAVTFLDEISLTQAQRIRFSRRLWLFSIRVEEQKTFRLVRWALVKGHGA